MNLKAELQKMSISDLRGVCRELGVSCPKSKNSIIKQLLDPLKKKYKKNKKGQHNKEFAYYKEGKLYKYTDPSDFGSIFRRFDDDIKIQPHKKEIINTFRKGKNDATKKLSRKRKPYGYVKGLSPIKNALNPDNKSVISKNSKEYKNLLRKRQKVGKGKLFEDTETIPVEQHLYLTSDEFNNPFLSKDIKDIKDYFMSGNMNKPMLDGIPIYQKKYNMNSNKIKNIDLLHHNIQKAIKHIQQISRQYIKNKKIFFKYGALTKSLSELDNVLIFKTHFGISSDYKRQIKEKIKVLNEYLQNAIDNEKQNTKMCGDLCSMSYKSFWKRYNSHVRLSISNNYLKKIEEILQQTLASDYRSLDAIIELLKGIIIEIKHEKDSILNFFNDDIDNKLLMYRLIVRESPDRKNLDEDIDFNVLNITA